MSKNKKILFILIVCGLALTLIPSFVLAADQTTGKLTNPLGTTSLPTLIGRVISAILGIVGSIALLMFIYGGFLWLTSAGAEQKITQGKNVITWATIGLAIIFLSYTLVGFVIKGLTTGGGAGGAGSAGGVDVEGQGLAIQGCCVSEKSGGSTCYAGADTDCQKGETFYPKTCNIVSICSGPVQKGCCLTGSGVCVDNTDEPTCTAMGDLTKQARFSPSPAKCTPAPPDNTPICL